MTKLIAHEYLKEMIFHDMAVKGESAEGLEILSLNRLLNDAEAENDTVLILKLAKQLRKDADKYPEYQKMFAFPSFYSEVLSFAKQMALWNLDAADLPADDENEKQLREIVKAALALDLKEKKTAEKLEESMDAILASPIEAVESFENDYFTYTVMNRLKARGLKTISYCDQNPSATVRRHALSTRMEIEGCAQYICRNEKPCTIVLCNAASQLPVLRQVFERYRIPFSWTNAHHNAALPKAFSALAQLAVFKDSEHLIKAIAAQAFRHHCDEDLLDFLSQVLDDIKAPQKAEEYAAAYAKTQSDKYDPEKALGRDPVTVYTKLEQRAADYFGKIQDSIDLLCECTDAKQKLINAYGILSVSPLLANSTELSAGRHILSELQDCIDLIENDDDVLFFAQMIETAAGTSHKLVSDFCTVTDLTHPVIPKENTYVLGCSGKAYPGFAPLGGVFDETYVRRIKGFPGLDERQKAYLSQLEWIEHSCTDELIWSYATNDYQGRELISAFELDRYGKSERWQLDSCSQKRNTAHALGTESAKDLFVRQDEDGNPYVSGSISSIESWFRCPYRYFLASGLYVRKPQTPDLSADSAGTWQHAVMEKAVFDEDGKFDPDYAIHLSEERIRELISPYFEALRIANPNDTVRISLSEERMVSSLKKTAEFLAEYEKSTTFVPHAAELTFRRFPVSEHVRLNGTIDRISKDPLNHMIEILDYKSSSKTLSPSSVKAGQQLQLLTYLIAAMDEMGKEEEISPAGTYYFSLSADNITDAKAASVNRSTWKLSENDLRNDEQAMHDLMVKSRQLSGWTFTQRTDAIDSEGRYVAGTKKTYIYEKIRECLDVLYEYFYANLTGANEAGMPVIDVSPVSGACTYCDYKGICRYHGEERKAEEIYTGQLAEERKKTK